MAVWFLVRENAVSAGSRCLSSLLCVSVYFVLGCAMYGTRKGLLTFWRESYVDADGSVDVSSVGLLWFPCSISRKVADLIARPKRRTRTSMVRPGLVGDGVLVSAIERLRLALANCCYLSSGCTSRSSLMGAFFRGKCGERLSSRFDACTAMMTPFEKGARGSSCSGQHNKADGRHTQRLW